MHKLTFLTICSEMLIEPGVALECPAVIDELQQQREHGENEDRMRDVLNGSF